MALSWSQAPFCRVFARRTFKICGYMQFVLVARSLLQRSCVSGVQTRGANAALFCPRTTCCSVQLVVTCDLAWTSRAQHLWQTSPALWTAPWTTRCEPHAQHPALHLSRIFHCPCPGFGGEVLRCAAQGLRRSTVAGFGKGSVQDAVYCQVLLRRLRVPLFRRPTHTATNSVPETFSILGLRRRE